MIKEQKPRFKNGLPPIHPGELLAEDLEAMAMSPAEFDAALAVPAGTTALLLDGCIDITPELALRLGCYLGRCGEIGGDLAAPAIRARCESCGTQARRSH